MATGAIAPRDELTGAERSVWESVGELRACYNRDETEMTTTHRVLTEVAPGPGKPARR